MAVSRASGIVQMPARASNMQSILFSTQNTYVTSPAGRPCAGLIGFRAKKGICKTTGGEAANATQFPSPVNYNSELQQPMISTPALH